MGQKQSKSRNQERQNIVNKCYSHNEEDFFPDYNTAIDLAVENFQLDNPGFSGETELKLFEADRVENTISQFLGSSIADFLAESACDSDGEAAESWASKIIQNSQLIQKTVKNALEDWANLTRNQPNFFGVKNVRPINVKIKVDKSGNWEDIS